MKYTSNYVVYLDENNRVYSARCRLTGKFVKRVFAQQEYSEEYVYNAYMSILNVFTLVYACMIAQKLTYVTIEFKSVWQAITAPYADLELFNREFIK